MVIKEEVPYGLLILKKIVVISYLFVSSGTWCFSSTSYWQSQMFKSNRLRRENTIIYPFVGDSISFTVVFQWPFKNAIKRKLNFNCQDLDNLSTRLHTSSRAGDITDLAVWLVNFELQNVLITTGKFLLLITKSKVALHKTTNRQAS